MPAERVLSVEHEAGRWEYLVVGPDEAAASLPPDQSHPWWPNAEQFVDFVVVRDASTRELAAEVASLRAAAPTRYAKADAHADTPLAGLDGFRLATPGEGGAVGGAVPVGQGPRQQQSEGDLHALTAEAHAATVAADLRLAVHREQLTSLPRMALCI